MRKLVFGLTLGAALAVFGDADTFTTADGLTATLASEPTAFYPQSGDVVLINDCEYVLIGKYDWAMLTNRLSCLTRVAARRLEADERTESGRVLYHGEKVKTEIREIDGSVYRVDVYADGFEYKQAAQKRVQKPVKATGSSGGATTPDARPKRLQAASRLREAASKGKAREVTAHYGVGGKLESVEGGAE